MSQMNYDVKGMSCASCQASVERCVRKLPGVNDVSVNLLTNKMKVDTAPDGPDSSVICQAVAHAGYEAIPIKNGVHNDVTSSNLKPDSDQSNSEADKLWHRFLLSLVLLIPLMYLNMGTMLGLPEVPLLSGHANALSMAFTQFILTIPVLLVNRNYYQRGFAALLHLHPNMDSLVAIGSGAAVLYGIVAIYGIGYGLGHEQSSLVMSYRHDLYFESAAMIVTLVTLGKFLEARSKGRTSDAIHKLMKLAPDTVTRITVTLDGKREETSVATSEVQVNDILLIRPGQNIPVDGIITLGSSTIDESALTGESMPVSKSVGKEVFSATTNQHGSFEMRATRVGADTSLARIIALVEEAGSSKAPVAKLADRISAVFVPIVIGIALIATLIWLFSGQSVSFAISIGICVLVISCPCALGLATPVAIMVGTGRAALDGILVRSAESLETFHKVDTIIFDKTGTLTEGKPTVTTLLPFGSLSDTELLQITASLEQPSEHPLAQAIINNAQTMSLSLLSVKDFTAIPGRGIQGILDGTLHFVGNEAFLKEQSICEKVDWNSVASSLHHISAKGETAILVANANQFLGIVAVSDPLKATSAAAVAHLQEQGMSVMMLSGDRKETAEAVAHTLGIEHVVAEVLPMDKESVIREQMNRNHIVAMVGDGINDAPALARADVGIAIGAGADIAMDSADIVLMHNNPEDVSVGIGLSRRIMNNIRMNLFWALFYNTIGIPVAAGVLYPIFGIKLNPMFGAAAMSLSSVCVVTNALRLRKPLRKSSSTKERRSSNMTKTMKIEGMSCMHCKASAEKALNQIDGVNAEVNLEKAEATIQCSKEVSNEILAAAITEAGFTPGEIL